MEERGAWTRELRRPHPSAQAPRHMWVVRRQSGGGSLRRGLLTVHLPRSCPPPAPGTLALARAPPLCTRLCGTWETVLIPTWSEKPRCARSTRARHAALPLTAAASDLFDDVSGGSGRSGAEAASSNENTHQWLPQACPSTCLQWRLAVFVAHGVAFRGPVCCRCRCVCGHVWAWPGEHELEPALLQVARACSAVLPWTPVKQHPCVAPVQRDEGARCQASEGR